MIILLVRTAGTPTSTVAGSASPRAKPTGTKSQPTCGLIANKAGSAIETSMLPLPISVPINTPTIWAITAPGPKSGDNKRNCTDYTNNH